MSRIRGLAVFLAAAVMVGVPTAARASSLTPLILDFTGAASDTLDFSGSFSSDNDVAVILFSLAAPTTISARTTSAATGGFDPILSLFRFSDSADLSTGLLIANNDDADFANSVMDCRAAVLTGCGRLPVQCPGRGPLRSGPHTVAESLDRISLRTGLRLRRRPDLHCGLYAADPAACGGFVASDGSARTDASGGTVELRRSSSWRRFRTCDVGFDGDRRWRDRVASANASREPSIS